MSERSVRFTLERNNFRQGALYGCVIRNSTIDLLSIVRRLAPWIHPDDVDELMLKIGDEVVRQVKDGICVTFNEYFSVEPFIEGAFKGEDDAYDPGRHCFSAKIHPGRKLRRLDAESRVTIRRVKSPRRDRRCV